MINTRRQCEKLLLDELEQQHREEIVAVRTQAVTEILEDLDTILAIARTQAIAET